MDVAPKQALRSLEEQLAEAQALAHLGSWEWHIPSNTVTWSHELYRIFGLQPQEFDATYEGFLACVHPDDLELIKREVERAYREGIPFSFEHRIVRPDGTVRWLFGRGRVETDEAGEP
jgi:two-component system sensor histidine kinase/response regulator